MQWYAKLLSFFRNLFRGAGADRELEAELHSYVEELADRKVAAGLAPQEASRQARLESDGVQQVKEKVRAARAGFWLQTFWQDVRYAARTLWAKPVFTLACTLTFAVGIGANTAIFSMVNALVLRKISAHKPERLTFFVSRLGNSWGSGFSLQDLTEIREQSGQAFSDVAGVRQFQREGLYFQGRSQSVWVDYVSTNFFSLMGIKPELGSFFAGNKLDSDEPAVVLSDSFWRSHFGGDPRIVGQTISINGQALTVTGVTPPGFHGAAELLKIQAFLPLGMARRLQVSEGAAALEHLLLLGRLKDGVNRSQANSALAVIARRLAEQYPDTHRDLGIHAAALGITNSTGGNPLPLVSALFLTLAGLVLLLAAANVTNLLLVRAAARNREMAVRSALGAARARLIRQLLTETFMLALQGGAAGVAMGAFAGRALSAIPTGEIPVVLDFSLDWRVFMFAFAVTLAVAVAGGLSPAWRASGVDLNCVLREGGRQSSTGRQRLRTALVIAQVAGSMTLLIVAGLFVRSLRHAQRQDPGFDPRSVMNFSLDPHGAGYDLARGRQYYADLRERVRVLPGVESASLVQAAPLDPEENVAELELDGGEGGQSRQAQVNYDSVSPEFFRTVRMRMVRGREFSESDSETAPRVAIINEVMAQRFWPATDPIGRQFRLRDDLHHPVQVVGVMHNAQMTDMFGPPGAFFLLPIAQHYVPRQTLMVRSSGPADAVAQPVLQLLRQMAPTVPVDGVMTMSRSMDGISGFLMFRLGAGLASALGLLGLLLAVIGIYGVVSYSAAQRTREIGIRMALGAPRSRVMAAILRQGAVIAGCGIAAGTLVATAIARLAGSFILGVSAFDPATYAGASVLLAAVTLLASLLPARRATRVDPSVVLRQE